MVDFSLEVLDLVFLPISYAAIALRLKGALTESWLLLLDGYWTHDHSLISLTATRQALKLIRVDVLSVEQLGRRVVVVVLHLGHRHDGDGVRDAAQISILRH